MITDHPLSGVYAAAITPLTPDVLPDLGAIPIYLEFLANRGCHGALLFGTTGEGPSFSPSECEKVWQAALKIRETHPDFRLLAGTGTPSLQESIELTKLSFDLGFNGVVVLPPYYFRNVSEEGLFAWFSRLIQTAVPADGFVLGYHFPGVAGIGFSLDLLARMKDAFAPKFAGIKDLSHDPALASDLGKKFGSDLAVFTGTDSYLSAALQNHASGCITAPANLISPDLREIYDAVMVEEDCSNVQALVTAKRQILEKYKPFPPVLKALIAKMHDFPRWPVRPPLTEISEDTVEEALKELAEVE